jgi:hypothetical protein
MKNLLVFFFLLPVISYSQDDLLNELEGTPETAKQFASAAFKGSRLINGHTVEARGQGELEFIFQHRFGLISGGLYEMYGLDQAFVRLGLDYGITDRLSASISRNSVDKTMDGYLKLKALKQSSGGGSPVTLTALGGIAYRVSPKKSQDPDFNAVNRIAYVGQLLIARKFAPWLSLQLMPTLVHKNAVVQRLEDNNTFAMGVGGRLKVSRTMALTTEFYPRINAPGNAALIDDNIEPKYNSFGFGIDLETGGHVFQLVITNTQSLTERAFITENTGGYGLRDLHFGFNVTRGFQVGKRR